MNKPDLLLDTLRGIRFLHDIDDAHLRLLVPITEVKQFPAGVTLFREGQNHPQIYLVLDGSIALDVRVSGQEAKRLQTVGAGELLGWSPILGQVEMTATAQGFALFDGCGHRRPTTSGDLRAQPQVRLRIHAQDGPVALEAAFGNPAATTRRVQDGPARNRRHGGGGMMDADVSLPVGCFVRIENSGLQAIVDRLKALGYRVVGPVVSESAVVYDDLESIHQMPIGVTDVQDAGSYRLAERAGHLL